MAELMQLDNFQRMPQQGRSVSNVSTNIMWQQETMAGNNAMAKELFFTAYDHYKIALSIAKKIFKVHQHHDKVPDDLISAIVISYLNICELWNKQNKATARKGYLCATFDYLVVQMRTPNISSNLQKQLRHGLDKVLTEMVEMGDMETIAMKKQILMTTL
jgi:hypothetical protein